MPSHELLQNSQVCEHRAYTRSVVRGTRDRTRYIARQRLEHFCVLRHRQRQDEPDQAMPAPGSPLWGRRRNLVPRDTPEWRVSPRPALPQATPGEMSLRSGRRRPRTGTQGKHDECTTRRLPYVRSSASPIAVGSPASPQILDLLLQVYIVDAVVDRPGFLARGEADAETNNRQVSLHVFGLQGIKKEQPPFRDPSDAAGLVRTEPSANLTASTGLRLPLTDRLIQSCLVGLVAEESIPSSLGASRQQIACRLSSGASGFFKFRRTHSYCLPAELCLLLSLARKHRNRPVRQLSDTRLAIDEVA